MVPKAADVARIAAHSDIVIRNLLITQCYHELSVAVRNHTGAGANWCTFATWASKQAGRTIRREDLRAALRARLDETPEFLPLTRIAIAAVQDIGAVRTVGALLDEILRALDAEAAFERAARAVADGNLKVFEEIALQFARFLEALTRGGADTLGQFLDELRPGEPPAGQRLLREAFAAYHATVGEPDQVARAQLMCYANLLIGLHEQTRLQPQIAAAMNAAFDEAAVRRRVIAALFGRRPPLDDIIDRLLAVGQRELRRVVTAQAMTLHLPAGTIVRLGADVTGAFPASLTTVSDPRLAELLQRIDPNPGSVAGSGAADWSELDERMHLIADLFRCRHDWEPLFEPPFTPVQLVALQGGRRPADPL